MITFKYYSLLFLVDPNTYVDGADLSGYVAVTEYIRVYSHYYRTYLIGWFCISYDSYFSLLHHNF